VRLWCQEEGEGKEEVLLIKRAIGGIKGQHLHVAGKSFCVKNAHNKQEVLGRTSDKRTPTCTGQLRKRQELRTGNGCSTNYDIPVRKVMLLQMSISAVASSASVTVGLLPFIGTFLP
jgi:hypothetical protein